MADETELRIGGKVLKDLRVKDLKEQLERRGLSKVGTKHQLLSRLKAQLILEKLQAQPVPDDPLPNVEDGADTENEFVKQYLEQRQRLFEAQREARRRLEEEEAHTHGSGHGDGLLPSEESLEDDSQTEPESPVKEAPGAVSAGEESSPMDLRSPERQSLSAKNRVESKASADQLTVKPPVGETGDSHQVKSSNYEKHGGGKPQRESEMVNCQKEEEVDDRDTDTEPDDVAPTKHSKEEVIAEPRLSEAKAKEATPQDHVISHKESVHHPSADKEEPRSPKHSVKSEPIKEAPVRHEDIKQKSSDLHLDIHEQEDLDYDEDIPVEDEKQNQKIEPSEPKEEEIAKSGATTNKSPTILPRKISLSKRGSSRDSKAEGVDPHDTNDKPKKRRWGASSKSSGSKGASINISTEKLKEIMPDLKLAVDSSEDSEQSVDEDEVVQVNRKESGPHSGKPSEQLRPKENRDVAQVVVSSSDEELEGADNHDDDGHDQQTATLTKHGTTLTLPVEDPVHVKQRLSPARNPVNCTIHIQNLVRPFTIGQLKELLGKHGTLVISEKSFWIDKIKSHCYATFTTEAEAESARKELHGCRWPSSNPKIMRVEFASLDELAFHKEREHAKLEGIPLESQQREAAAAAERKAAEEAERLRREKEREERVKMQKQKQRSPEPAAPVREWDRHKLRQSQSPPPAEKAVERPQRAREREGRRGKKDRESSADRKHSVPAVPEPPPAKLLDDLFKKTKAQPAVYWLPLTDVQIAAKQEKETQDQLARIEKKKEEEKERLEKLRLADEKRQQINEKYRKEREEKDKLRQQERQRRRSDSDPRSQAKRRRSKSSSSSDRSRSRTPVKQRSVNKSPQRKRSPQRRNSGGSSKSRSRSPVSQKDDADK